MSRKMKDLCNLKLPG